MSFASDPGGPPGEQAAEEAVASAIAEAAVEAAQAPPEPAEEAAGEGAPGERSQAKSLTIGAVVKALVAEFPDISISKVRYLEDQKLLAPRRTPGGYRLYSQGDVSRLRTILRLQRDEFLPLRVIRQELAAGRTEADIASPAPAEKAAPGRTGAAMRRAHFSLRETGAVYSLADVTEETGADPRLVAELEEYGIIAGQARAGTRYYDDTEREIVRAVTELSRYGVAGRNLRVFRTDRESQLLQQILAPALRSRNPERRKEAIEALENLAAVASHLKHLLLIRDLRRLAK